MEPSKRAAFRSTAKTIVGRKLNLSAKALVMYDSSWTPWQMVLTVGSRTKSSLYGNMLFLGLNSGAILVYLPPGFGQKTLQDPIKVSYLNPESLTKELLSVGGCIILGVIGSVSGLSFLCYHLAALPFQFFIHFFA